MSALDGGSQFGGRGGGGMGMPPGMEGMMGGMGGMGGMGMGGGEGGGMPAGMAEMMANMKGLMSRGLFYSFSLFFSLFFSPGLSLSLASPHVVPFSFRGFFFFSFFLRAHAIIFSKLRESLVGYVSSAKRYENTTSPRHPNPRCRFVAQLGTQQIRQLELASSRVRVVESRPRKGAVWFILFRPPFVFFCSGHVEFMP